MSYVRKGEPWGRPATGPADAEVTGGDPALAALATRLPGARVEFHPIGGSDLARALGIEGAVRRPAPLEVPIDGLRHGPLIAVNAIVLGTPPDRMRWWSRSRLVEVRVDWRERRERFAGRAAAVVIASGQYLRGADLVPRGHPGDGRVEVQVYALRPGERRAMRSRLPRGDHLPHPRIRALSGTRVEVAIQGRPMALEVDGVARGRGTGLIVDVVPAALWVRI